MGELFDSKSFDIIVVTITNVIAVVSYLVMKIAALGRGKPKDAYDIYFVIKHYQGGVRRLAEEFTRIYDKQIIKEMKQKLLDKFASVNYVGVKDIINLNNCRYICYDRDN